MRNTKLNIIFEFQNSELLNDCSEIPHSWNHHKRHEIADHSAQKDKSISGWAELLKLLVGRIHEYSLLSDEVNFICIFHGKHEFSYKLINQKCKDDDYHAE